MASWVFPHGHSIERRIPNLTWIDPGSSHVSRSSYGLTRNGSRVKAFAWNSGKPFEEVDAPHRLPMVKAKLRNIEVLLRWLLSFAHHDRAEKDPDFRDQAWLEGGGKHDLEDEI